MKALVASDEYAQGTLVHFETSYEHVYDFLKWKYNQTDIDVKKLIMNS